MRGQFVECKIQAWVKESRVAEFWFWPSLRVPCVCTCSTTEVKGTFLRLQIRKCSCWVNLWSVLHGPLGLLVTVLFRIFFSHSIPLLFHLLDRYLSLREQLCIIFPLLNYQNVLYFLHNQTLPIEAILIIHGLGHFQHQVLQGSNRVQLRQTNRWDAMVCWSFPPPHFISQKADRLLWLTFMLKPSLCIWSVF